MTNEPRSSSHRTRKPQFGNLDDEDGNRLRTVVCAILLLLAILAAVLIEHCRKKAKREAQRSSVNMNKKEGRSSPTQMNFELPNERVNELRRSSVRSRRKSSCVVQRALSIEAPLSAPVDPKMCDYFN